jgi:hypothetical protein
MLKASHSEPRPTMRHTAENEDVLATPVLHRACDIARPYAASTTSSILVYQSSGLLRVRGMSQLNPEGYPTRALYYLHKRMLDISLRRRIHQLKKRPRTSIALPLPEEYDDEEYLKQNNQGNPNSMVAEVQALHNLCATLVSADYIVPPSPPRGGTPWATPSKFEMPVKAGRGHDEHACRIASMLVRSGTLNLDVLALEEMQTALEEMQVELECGLRGLLPVKGRKWAYLSSVPREEGVERNTKSLFEEMQMDGVETPGAKYKRERLEAIKAEQGRRRARNLSKGTRGAKRSSSRVGDVPGVG